ncbi:MAG: radical SAM protein [Deltaproteobacteria bacterium]|nr:radical SAM protein [Deltaproteobacteria bacterium]MBW1920609.1 radical SAM protein [Deltaproteobacteria bacterium]MBW1934343.1 radical SAM protein [Deltaproteobacteria bacterium]MBW1977312.1 radical SAM protein [Deltaproteobacteria bacterium]MBW2043472.1 radical SAM protein [Deltaproteobacteria bacterium]
MIKKVNSFYRIVPEKRHARRSKGRGYYMSGIFDRLRRSKDHISLDWIQIEVTSLCEASCLYCPHTAYRKQWLHGSMSLDTFQTIAAEFHMAKLIYLQGWGEPFSNENLFQMIEIAKRSGRKVGLTTNGMALDSETLDHLIDLRLDILAVSLAGTTPAIHNRLRARTDFNQITDSLFLLKKKKTTKNSRLPQLHLAYIMLRSNFGDLAEIIPYARKVGSENIVCSNLAFLPESDLQKEAIFLDQSNRKYYEDILNAVKASSVKNNVNFHSAGSSLEKPLPICPENILRSCYISHDGFVSSCVFTNIPLSNRLESDEAKGKRLSFPERITYGNIGRQPLSEIWYSAAYESFRKTFEERQKNMIGSIDAMVDAALPPLIETNASGKRNEPLLERLPSQCRTCYKMYGV